MRLKGDDESESENVSEDERYDENGGDNEIFNGLSI